jgi:hypothetical protein
MVQPGVARAFMADPMAVETGFLARFLTCEPPSAIGTRLHANARQDRRPVEAFAARLAAVLAAPMPMDPETRELRPRILPLSGGAREMLVQFSDAIEEAQGPSGNLAHVTGSASKAAEQAARIAGVLTIWRDLHAQEVAPKDMADAIALAGFYLSEAARLVDCAKVSTDIDKAERLRQWLIDRWPHPEVTPSEILRHAPNRDLRERPAAKKAIGTLVEAGWLVPLEQGEIVRGAARKEAYRIVRGQ